MHFDWRSLPIAIADLVLVTSHEHLERSECRIARRYGKQTIDVASYLLASRGGRKSFAKTEACSQITKRLIKLMRLFTLESCR